MKIATNVTRDAFGGITISNLALFDWLEPKTAQIVGIEYVIDRSVLGATIFRKYSPAFFRHNIISSLDIAKKYPWEKAWTMKQLRRRWNILVETTKNILRKEEADIVLINGTYFAPWILAVAAKELGIPIVVRYAGVLQREARHKNYFERARLLNYERFIGESADAIIFPSTLCKTVVEKEILQHSVKNSFVIPNSVHIARRPARKPHARFTIAAVGRWSGIKNFTAFIDLHKELRRKRWAHRAVLVTQTRDNKVQIPETIERIAPMSQDDLRKFYTSIDLLVVPSHFETFCNVAAEAAILGTPVLVSENVGFSEFLKQAGLERMVIPDFSDLQAVIKVVKRLSGTQITLEERAKLGKLLDPHRVHDEILNVLKDVLTKPVV